MPEKILWIAGSLPFILLGAMHLLYTFFSNKFEARDSAVTEAMKTSVPILTKKTTMWKAWIGFNGSHSSGAIYIGVINLFLAVQYFSVVTHPFFLAFNLVTIFFYLWLGKKYWFSTPFRGIVIAACCFVAATVMIVFK
jgi:hypothetical protein